MEKENCLWILERLKNYNKEVKPWCLNYNIYGHITKDYREPKREKEMRKYYKCDKVGHLVKNYRIG